jgi:hypothetical protein
LEVLSFIFTALLVLILVAVAVFAIKICAVIILAFWPTMLGLFALVSLWSGGNSNAGVILFIVGVIGNFYWSKQSARLKWVESLRTFLVGEPSRGYSDTRSEKEILQDIERKMDDPYS